MSAGAHSKEVDLQFAITRCRVGDERRLSLLAKATFLETYADSTEGADLLDFVEAEHSAERCRSWLESDFAKICIAETIPGHSAIGYAVALISSDGWFGVEVKRLYVLYRFQRNGLGRLLMNEILATARHDGIAQPFLRVQKVNQSAVDFYSWNGLLFRTVHRITRNREDAEDAVQDSLLRAFLHLKSFDGRSTFSTWLTRIGINSALMILRKKRNSREISADGGGVHETLWEVPDCAPNPEIRCAQRERERFLRDAIAGLRPRLRRTLEFHTLQDHSLRETAAQIGISATAAKARFFHDKAALRKSKVLRKINEPNWHGLELKRQEL